MYGAGSSLLCFIVVYFMVTCLCGCFCCDEACGMACGVVCGVAWGVAWAMACVSSVEENWNIGDAASVLNCVSISSLNFCRMFRMSCACAGLVAFW